MGEVDTQESTSSVSYTDLATVGPAVTVQFAGDYVISFGASVQAPATAEASMSFQVGSTAAASVDMAKVFNNTAAVVEASVARHRFKTDVPAGSVITAKYGTTFGAGTSYFTYRWLHVIPVRIGG